MLTNRGKYGLKAMVHLAGTPKGTPVLAADIATAENIPKKFLDAILGELRMAGLVSSKKGRGGGFTLARSAEDIAVGQIVRALDGMLAPIACASKNYYRKCDDCPSEGRCRVQVVMMEVRASISNVLDQRSLADIHRPAAEGKSRRRIPAKAQAPGDKPAKRNSPANSSRPAHALKA